MVATVVVVVVAMTMMQALAVPVWPLAGVVVGGGYDIKDDWQQWDNGYGGSDVQWVFWEKWRS